MQQSPGLRACELPWVQFIARSISTSNEVAPLQSPINHLKTSGEAQRKPIPLKPSTARKGKIIVFGILFWYPLAGVTYQFLHYLLGLRRLGYDPYYVEDSGRWVYDPRINDLSPDASGNIAAVLSALQAHGFGERWAFRGKYPDGKCYGMSEAQIDQLYREADAFLNVTGAQELREEHLAINRRIYVESDPFASQIKVAIGDAGM